MSLVSPAPRPTCQPVRLVVPDTTPDDVLAESLPRGRFEAVAIGPESDFDLVYLYAGGTAPRDTGVIAAAGRAAIGGRSAGIPVSVRRPHVGEVNGPFRIGSQMTQLASTAGTRRTMTGIASARKGLVDLLFYPFRPEVIPTDRADSRFMGQYTFGAQASAETDLFIAPAFGRVAQLFSFARVTGSNAYSSGTFTVRVYGEQFIGRISGVDQFATTELIESAIASNAFDLNVEYEGRFDYYRVTTQEASLSGPDGIFEGQVLLRDRS